MSLNDLLTNNKKKREKPTVKKGSSKKKPISEFNKATDNHIKEEPKKKKYPSLEKPSIFQVLGFEPSETIFTFDEFELWFREMATKVPYFKAYVKQAKDYGKKTDIVSHYFAALFYFQHKLNSKVN